MTQDSAVLLKNWFLRKKRSFPWREDPTPYKVWISEIMLQQTRASVVVGYFTRWMELFPTISAVASAPIEDLIKAWEGLGYYSRVRNIKKAAVAIEEKGGVFPSSLEELLQVPGIGPYTAGAIASFAFHQKAAAVDGNVSRVISRYYGLEGVIKKDVLEEKTLLFLPNEQPWVAMEALIELGATACQKKSKCQECPISWACVAYKEGKVGLIPAVKKRPDTIYLHKQVAIILYQNEVLVEKKEEGKVLGGLTEFPSFEYSLEELEEVILKELCLEVEFQEELSKEKQSFTRYQVELSPLIFQIKEKKEVKGFVWFCIKDLPSLTFSSGHKKILLRLMRDFFRIK